MRQLLSTYETVVHEKKKNFKNQLNPKLPGSKRSGSKESRHTIQNAFVQVH